MSTCTPRATRSGSWPSTARRSASFCCSMRWRASHGASVLTAFSAARAGTARSRETSIDRVRMDRDGKKGWQELQVGRSRALLPDPSGWRVGACMRPRVARPLLDKARGYGCTPGPSAFVYGRPRRFAMAKDKAEADEARRIAQHERIKEKVESDVHSGIAREAEVQAEADRARYGSVAAGLRRKAADEVVETEREVDRARTASRVQQVTDYVFFLVYSLIGLEIVLELLGARQSSGFKQFLDDVTTPLLAPFKGLLPNPSLGSLQLMLSYVAALAVYAILHQAIKRLLRMFTGRPASA